MSRRAAIALACAVWASAAGGAAVAQTPADPLILWHAYGDGEAEALSKVLAAFEVAHPGERVQAVRLPFGVLASRLESAVPTGNGPDLFIDAHERLGRYAQRGVVEPLDPAQDPTWDATLASLEPAHVDALRHDGRLYGWPLSAKAIALFINRRLVRSDIPPDAPLEARLRQPFPDGVWPLAVEGEDAYFAAPFFHAYGASLFASGRFALAHDGATTASAPSPRATTHSVSLATSVFHARLRSPASSRRARTSAATRSRCAASAADSSAPNRIMCRLSGSEAPNSPYSSP